MSTICMVLVIVATSDDNGDAMTSTPATERNNKNYSTDVVIDTAQADAIRQTLYRTDAATVGRILPNFSEKLAEGDVAFFREHGYLAMNGMLTDTEIEDCKAALSDLAHRRTVWDKRVWSQEEPFFAAGGRGRARRRSRAAAAQAGLLRSARARLNHVATHPRLRAIVDTLIGRARA